MDRNFLMKIWNHSCRTGDIVFLSTKSQRGYWKEHPFEFNRGIRSRLKDFYQEFSRGHDIYFCPLPYKSKRRKKEQVRKVNLLWSDIDSSKSKIKPSILWESSPGRLQGVWFLDKTLIPEDGEDLNKSLSYYLDADKSGWDLGQVLRVPGTINYKYDSKPRVRVLNDDGKIYKYRSIVKRIGYNPGNDIPESMDQSFEMVFSKYRRQIPVPVKKLLTQKNVKEGKRSDVIWYLENKLSEVGLTPPEIITLIKNSSWNKFKGRSDEDLRLRTEMEKIIERNSSGSTEGEVKKSVDEITTEELVIEDYMDIMTSLDSIPGWLVKGFWMNQSHGIIAGEPKSFKSTLALDLAVSVASGTKFLNKYPVDYPGPVIYIQNENAKWIMKDRISKISSSRGLVGKVRHVDKNRVKIKWPPKIPLYTINQQGFLLTDPVHQKLLEEVFKKYRPNLIILDPLYLMFDGDINSAKDLNSVLSWLLELRYKYKCGIMIVHHYNKGNGNHPARGGQRMLGSTTLHGWTESAWYVTVDPDQSDLLDSEDKDSSYDSAEVTIEKEFRGAGLYPKLDLEIRMGEIGDFNYSIEIKEHVEKNKKTKKVTNEELQKTIINILKEQKVVNKIQLLKVSGGTLEQVNKLLERLHKEEIIKIIDGKVYYDSINSNHKK